MGDLNLRCSISKQDIVQFDEDLANNEFSKNLSLCYILVLNKNNNKIICFPMKTYYSNYAKFGNFKFYDDIKIEHIFGILSFLNLIKDSDIFIEEKENINKIIISYKDFIVYKKENNDFLIAKDSHEHKEINLLIQNIFNKIVSDYNFNNLKLSDELSISFSVVSNYVYNELIKTHPYLNISKNNQYSIYLFNEEKLKIYLNSTTPPKLYLDSSLNSPSLSHIFLHEELNDILRNNKFDIYDKRIKIESNLIDRLTYGYYGHIDFSYDGLRLLSLLHYNLNKDFSLPIFYEQTNINKIELNFNETKKYFDIEYLNFFDKFVYFSCAVSRFNLTFEPVQLTSYETNNEDGLMFQNVIENSFHQYNIDCKLHNKYIDK